MRYVNKTNRCAPFETYATGRPRVWNIDANIKLILHQHLWAEQKSLCVYCQQSIRKKLMKDSTNPLHPSHIEHIRPKDGMSAFNHLIFEHTNLAVSCNGNDVDNDLDNVQKHCGHAKQNLHNDTLFLHPFEISDVEDYFQYDLNGKITPSVKNPNRAHFTIDLLKLNHTDLDSMREQQYQTIINEVNNNGLDIDDFLDSNYLQLPKFHSMLKQLFYV